MKLMNEKLQVKWNFRVDLESLKWSESLGDGAPLKSLTDAKYSYVQFQRDKEKRRGQDNRGFPSTRDYKVHEIPPSSTLTQKWGFLCKVVGKKVKNLKKLFRYSILS